MRVATWMLVGNGAALLACFNAAIGGGISDWGQVQPFALSFLVGMIAAVASVALEGEAENRSAARLILLGGASRRAAIGIDANAEFRTEQARHATPSAEIDQQIKANDKVIDEARSILETKSEEPIFEKVLRRVGRVLLGASASCLGVALYLAITSDAVEAAIGK